MSTRLSWGVLGAGRIAGVFTRGVATSATGEVVAVGSRSSDKAGAFAAEHGLPRAYGSYEALLDDKSIDAVYVATPHPMHAEWSIRAAEAGKHILCEKPLAMNQAEVMAMIEAARRNDVFLMEAFMYRCHPQTVRLAQMVRDGTVGEVRLIQSFFSFNSRAGLESRLIDPALGGGGILDVGCYSASIARFLAAAALGRDSVEPIEVRATGKIGKFGIDDTAIASLEFDGGILAQIGCGIRQAGDNMARVVGTEGTLMVSNAFTPKEGRILLTRGGDEAAEVIEVGNQDDAYALEADSLAANLERRQSPAMSWDDSLGNIRTLDRWRAEIGLTYPTEDPDGPGQDRPLHGRTLAVRAGAAMAYGEVEGVGKPMSRLVLGVDNQRTWPQTAVMLDDYFERGGTCFDTAYIYMSGLAEKNLGDWIRRRGVRDQAVILAKGAHTPFCDPDHLSSQLEFSLQRLGTDYADIYLMHRDNLEVPVGEFISVLEEHRRAGRIHVYGASNWSLERLKEANAWAAENGAQGFRVVSNNFSLARMVEPPWAGCASAADHDWRAWLTETQTPLMPWSSQARGFFVRADPADRSDEELVRCWYAEDNFQRLERARQLAKEGGVETVTIALAYVLSQPFPTFPLIGPRQLSETRTSFQALGIELTPEEVRWLNLESAQR
ncbi:MAG TPA: aldo/keto reductase [Candidatus Dormibacteraeota bacterium]|jgi:predicted dehydrogenase/aryl-alcohol dehydrogenase-like predicted oxidoreductase|nr:aldo/keto reductase [Candidatus Dormibacteraeota bacterium]